MKNSGINSLKNNNNNYNNGALIGNKSKYGHD